MDYKIGSCVHVQLVADESWHLGTLIGLVDLETDPDYLAREESEEEDGGEVPEEVIEFAAEIEGAAENFGMDCEVFIEELMKDIPKIKLDNGAIVFGFECYWSEITLAEEQELKKGEFLYKAIKVQNN